MKTPWIVSFLVLASLAGALMLPGCASTPDKMASALPPMPPLPKVSPAPSGVPALKLARNSVLPALPEVNDWGSLLAWGMGGTWKATNGGFLIDSRVQAHHWFIYLLSDKPEPILPAQSANLWLLSTNQANEFLQLANKLRLEENIAIYSSGR